jgi:hypothetical protein
MQPGLRLRQPKGNAVYNGHLPTGHDTSFWGELERAVSMSSGALSLLAQKRPCARESTLPADDNGKIALNLSRLHHEIFSLEK